MPLLTKKKAMTVVIETSPGVVASGALTASANATMQMQDPKGDATVEKLDIDAVSDSITRQKQAIGRKLADFSGSTFMRGPKAPNNTVSDSAPLFGRLLQASGFREVVTKRVGLSGSITGGPFRHGEVVEGGTSGAKGRVIHEVHDGDTILYYELLTATDFQAGSETITGDSTGATVTKDTNATAADGWSWYPISQVQFVADTTGTLVGAVSAGDVVAFEASGSETGRGRVIEYDATANTLTYELIRGLPATGNDIVNLTQTGTGLDLASVPAYYQGVTVAASMFEDGLITTGLAMRANTRLDMTVNRPVNVVTTLQGRLDEAAGSADGGTGDWPMPTGIDYDNSTAPLWAGQTFELAPADASFTGEAQEVCVTEMSLDPGAQLVPRECAAAVGGLEEIAITEREGTASLNPEATLEADVPILGQMIAGDVMRVRAILGATAGNKFTISGPGLQVVSAPTADRNGNVIRDIQADLTGGDMHNLVGAKAETGMVVSSTGGDNEMVISYHAAP